jgi:hypothetical protein
MVRVMLGLGVGSVLGLRQEQGRLITRIEYIKRVNKALLQIWVMVCLGVSVG